MENVLAFLVVVVVGYIFFEIGSWLVERFFGKRIADKAIINRTREQFPVETYGNMADVIIEGYMLARRLYPDQDPMFLFGKVLDGVIEIIDQRAAKESEA